MTEKNLPPSVSTSPKNGTPNNRVIVGTVAKCIDGRWSDRDDLAVPSELLVLATTTALQRWERQLPVETLVQQPNVPLPSVDELNAKIPRDKWERGIDGEPRKPWALQHIAYLLDPKDASIYTFINATVGAAIAVERLRERMKWMRALRGANVHPLVKLDSRPMPTKFGQKMRPEFTVIDWRELSVQVEPRRAAAQLEHKQTPTPELGEPEPVAAVETTAPQKTQRRYKRDDVKSARAADGKPIRPVTTEEALDDDIMY